MRTHRAGVYAVALATVLAGCSDSAAAPGGDAGTDPSFATTSSATQFHFVANGVSGQVGWYQSDSAGFGFTYGQVNVGRGGTTSNPQTWLDYYVVRCDWYYCYLVGAGYGLIPNRDLSGGSSQLHLSTTTTGNPNFFVWAGSGGQVSVDWRANGLFSSRSSGTNEYTYAAQCDTLSCNSTFTHRSQGRGTSASATASGTVVAVPIGFGQNAAIGTNHQVSIDIYR